LGALLLRGRDGREGERKGKGHEPPPQYLKEVYAYAMDKIFLVLNIILCQDVVYTTVILDTSVVVVFAVGCCINLRNGNQSIIYLI